jgi:hypothetical protein
MYDTYHDFESITFRSLDFGCRVIVPTCHKTCFLTIKKKLLVVHLKLVSILKHFFINKLITQTLYPIAVIEAELDSLTS